MRRALPIAVAALACLPATAAADKGRLADFDLRLSATAPGAPTGMTTHVLFHRPDDPDAKPSPLRSAVIHLPDGLRLDSGALPQCEASDDELRARGVVRRTADHSPGFPCRVSLRDAEPGETVLLLNYEHQPADTPYRASHAIYVREGAVEARPGVGEVPDVLRRRLLSVRAFDADGMMVDADVAEGGALEPVIARLFGDPAVAYLHVHNAKPGCYAARVERA
jgi:hypothetical protein